MHYCYIISKVHVKCFEMIDVFQTMLHNILCLKALHVACSGVFNLSNKNCWMEELFFGKKNSCDWRHNTLNTSTDMAISFSF